MENELGLDHVDWSPSTASLYETCPRRFYYRYGESTEYSSSESGEKQTAIDPPGAKVGMVVHDCIEEQISRWRHGESLSLQAAQTSATEQLQAYLEDREEAFEARYVDENEEFDATAFARSLVRTAHQHLETFFQVIWPQLNDHNYILHEQTTSFEIGGATVWVRPDLCTRSPDGDFVVTDWKTSLPDRFSEPSLQVKTYALWAHQEYEPELDRILVQLVHTNRGEFDRLRPSSDDISSIRNRIVADYENWTSSTDQSDFETRPEDETCRSCPYLHLCPVGQSVVDDAT